MVLGSKASSSLISVFSFISTTLSHLAKTHNGEGPRRVDLRPMKGGNETHNGEGEQRGLWWNRLKTPPPKSYYNNAKTPKQRESLLCLCMVEDLRWLGSEIRDPRGKNHKPTPTNLNSLAYNNHHQAPSKPRKTINPPSSFSLSISSIYGFISLFFFFLFRPLDLSSWQADLLLPPADLCLCFSLLSPICGYAAGLWFFFSFLALVLWIVGLQFFPLPLFDFFLVCDLWVCDFFSS